MAPRQKMTAKRKSMKATTSRKKNKEAPAKIPDTWTLGPKENDRILVLKEYWLNKVKAGEKCLEVRGTTTRPGGCWLASKGKIHAWALFGQPYRCESLSHFESLAGQHRLEGASLVAELPYKRTWLWPMERVEALHHPIRYQQVGGQLSWARFRKPRV